MSTQHKITWNNCKALVIIAPVKGIDIVAGGLNDHWKQTTPQLSAISNYVKTTCANVLMVFSATAEVKLAGGKL